MSAIRCSRTLFLLAVCFLCGWTASAQTNVGIINMQRALLDTAEMKKAQADLEAKYRPRQQELAKVQKELEEIQKQLQMGDKLTPQAQQELTIQGQRKQRELQRLGEDLQADVDYERNNILSKGGRQLQEIVAKLAQEKGLDVVIDATDTVYFREALEMTQEATAAYDKAHPVQ